MKIARFAKVVQRCGRPEVYVLMSETDPDFRKALDAERVMSLSGEAHGSSVESGTVGYDKKQHGQLLVFPKSLKSFANFKIIGIKYDLFAQDRGARDEEPSKGRVKKTEDVKVSKHPLKSKSREKKAKKPIERKPTKKVIPFPNKKMARRSDETHGIKTQIRRAMQALEKGNSVAAYNVLKRIMADS